MSNPLHHSHYNRDRPVDNQRASVHRFPNTPNTNHQTSLIVHLLQLSAYTATAGLCALVACLAPGAVSAQPESVTTASKNPTPNPTEIEPWISQVRSVSELTDVRTTDWAYGALDTLVNRYQCINGFPDRTFRGRQTLTRYEFAAALNQCLDRLNTIIAQGQGERVSVSDLTSLQRLQAEYSNELSQLVGRVNAFEDKVNRIEAQQFSTTTKLSGEAIVATSGVLSRGKDPLTSPFRTGSASQNLVMQNRVRLTLDTSFSGRDQLRTRLQMGNAQPLLTTGNLPSGANALASNEGRLGFDDSSLATNNNSVFLDTLSYRFPLYRVAQVTVFANGGNHFNYADTLNPYFDDQGGGSGALSRFGERNPLYNINGNGAGFGVNFKVNDNLKFDFGYLANQAATTTQGLTGGNSSALAQVIFQPSENFKLGLAYVSAYNGSTAGQNGFRYGGSGQATGSFQSNLIAGANLSPGNSLPNTPVSSNSYGVSAFYQVNPSIALGGWAGYTTARLFSLGDTETWNYALTLAFPNAFREGNLLGIIAGIEPTLKGVRTYNGTNIPINNSSDVWHLEGFYRMNITKNISITPGLVWLFNPNQASSNGGLVIGTVRTTFSF